MSALLVLAACDQTPDTNAGGAPAGPIRLDGDPTTTISQVEPTGATAPGGVAGAVRASGNLDATVWFAGFEIHLTGLSHDEEDQEITIDAEVENQGSNEASLFEDASLERDGLTLEDGRLSSDTVLPGSRLAATISFGGLDEDLDLAGLTLVLGDGQRQQVRVPLSGGEPERTGRPAVAAAPPPIRTGGLTITVDELSVRHDNPGDHAQAPEGRAFVILDGSARFDHSSEAVGGKNIVLSPPNGAPQSADMGSVYPDKGSSEDLYAVFEVPAPVGGTYELIVQGEFQYSDPEYGPDTDARSTTVITLPSYPPAGDT